MKQILVSRLLWHTTEAGKKLYRLTVRPKGRKPDEGIVIGLCYKRKEAKIIQKWLNDTQVEFRQMINGIDRRAEEQGDD